MLVGSRNEALGMVGLEAIAAGALLVAQRSTGYAAIIDPDRYEGLLFDKDEPAAVIADRVLTAIDDYPRYEAAARRKAAASFDARHVVERLGSLWADVRALRR